MMDVRKMASMGQKAMRENQSKAEKVFWPLQAGRTKELKPGLIEAVHIGRGIADKLFNGMREAKLDLKEATCVLVCVKDNNLAGHPPFTPDNEDVNDLEMARMILHAKWEPIGVAFMLLDREKGRLLMHSRPFQRDERSLALADALLNKWAADFYAGKMRGHKTN